MTVESVAKRASSYVVRPPRQVRSQESWRRILDAGREIIEHGGAEALTLASLCKKADVAPTTVYQRVDSMNALIFAIFQDRMAELEIANSQRLAEVLSLPAQSPERVRAALDAVAETFNRDKNFLRAVTEYSVSDDAFWQSEDENANHFVAGIQEAITFGDELAAVESTHHIFTENMVRIIFGSHWMGSTHETFEQFQQRVFSMVWARLNCDPSTN